MGDMLGDQIWVLLDPEVIGLVDQNYINEETKTSVLVPLGFQKSIPQLGNQDSINAGDSSDQSSRAVGSEIVENVVIIAPVQGSVSGQNEETSLQTNNIPILGELSNQNSQTVSGEIEENTVIVAQDQSSLTGQNDDTPGLSDGEYIPGSEDSITNEGVISPDEDSVVT
ncbi:hypothetical protein L873DRAFT_1847267 [Choiromyces venosus 120613-1]|uniref:Uncharacterized protein n=1 Tax=Choiromyces venosus 120613-1 TaxID=1336337 RepID=A0A3N4J4N4_9PEZI|nr:hypothetical protein L873DRAFT_1847267 [Choiromyces venosus 120613-1]